ncbi:unnamed protein product, partial [Nippostrongylus brasiliensis]|uniref:Uncharacterized protein n=1 Tax=Nippostrongylus brasiliensis TaxID=27835 RepID=A0A0N4XRB6_NIPBR
MADRASSGLAIDGVIVEECDPSAAVLRHPYHRYNRAAAQSRAASMYNPRVYSGYYGSHACKGLLDGSMRIAIEDGSSLCTLIPLHQSMISLVPNIGGAIAPSALLSLPTL